MRWLICGSLLSRGQGEVASALDWVDATSGVFTVPVTLGVVGDAMVRLTCAGWIPLDGVFGSGAEPLV